MKKYVTAQEEKETMNFFEDLVKLKGEGKLPAVVWREQGGVLFLHIYPLLEAWLVDHYSRTSGAVLIKTVAVREYLKAAPGFLGISYNKRIQGRVCRCTVFSKKHAPKELLELIHGKPVADQPKRFSITISG